jgi:hypothetical protein
LLRTTKIKLHLCSEDLISVDLPMSTLLLLPKLILTMAVSLLTVMKSQLNSIKNKETILTLTELTIQRALETKGRLITLLSLGLKAASLNLLMSQETKWF